VLDIKTVGSATRTIKTSWQLQARMYSIALNRDVEFHTVSRAKQPKVFTALESEDLLMRLSASKNELMTRQAVTVARMLSWCWENLGPDVVWPANFMSDACGWCGFRPVCDYWRE
jgi:hypothetical protein